MKTFNKILALVAIIVAADSFASSNANTINEEIKNMENQELIENARIILTTDSNDAKNEWIRKITINGKKLNGGSNYKPTCCTTLIRNKNDRSRSERKEAES